MPAPAHLFACLKWGVLLITSLRDTVNRLDSSSVLSQQMSVELNWSVKSIPEGLCQHIIKRSNRVVVLVVLFVLFRFCGSVLCIFCSVEVDLFLFIQLCLRKLISVLLMKMQVAVSTKRMATSQIPNYPNLPSQLLCQVQNVTLHVCSLWSIHTCSRSEWS